MAGHLWTVLKQCTVQWSPATSFFHEYGVAEEMKSRKHNNNNIIFDCTLNFMSEEQSEDEKPGEADETESDAQQKRDAIPTDMFEEGGDSARWV